MFDKKRLRFQKILKMREDSQARSNNVSNPEILSDGPKKSMRNVSEHINTVESDIQPIIDFYNSTTIANEDQKT